ncbi:MAG: lipid II flippase MurJ, partial [Pseudomonadota bacterium]
GGDQDHVEEDRRGGGAGAWATAPEGAAVDGITPAQRAAGTWLAWGVVAAGIAQLALVWWAAARAGLPVVPRRPRLTPELRQLAIIAAPAALAGGVMQINLVIGRQVASYWEGAIGWLWLADRVYQLPLGLIGVAIGVVLLPTLARHLRAGDARAALDAQARSAEFALALTLPATAALLAMPGLVVAVLFERGAFTAGDTQATALALAVYALGLPAFVLAKVLQPAFFARHDTRSPLRYAAWSMLANLVVAVGAIPLIGWLAAPAGAVAAAWLQLALLWQGARRIEGATAPDPRLARRWPRMLAASVIMGAAVYALARLAEDLPPATAALALAGIVAAGMATYALACTALGAYRPADLKAALRRRKTG